MVCCKASTIILSKILMKKNKKKMQGKAMHFELDHIFKTTKNTIFIPNFEWKYTVLRTMISKNDDKWYIINHSKKRITFWRYKLANFVKFYPLPLQPYLDNLVWIELEFLYSKVWVFSPETLISHKYVWEQTFTFEFRNSSVIQGKTWLIIILFIYPLRIYLQKWASLQLLCSLQVLHIW